MSSFENLRIVDNFYQTSLFFPMPTVVISTLCDDLSEQTEALKDALDMMPAGMTHEEQMNYHHDIIVERMAVLRTVIDELETLTAAEYWPYPTYTDLLFSV